jgi:hypothetical protein
MRVSDVINHVRIHLSDTSEDNPRWADATLLAYFADAVHEAAQARSDLLLTEDGLDTLPTSFTTASELDWPLFTRWPLVLLTAAAALSEDADDRGNLERARMYRLLALARLETYGTEPQA